MRARPPRLGERVTSAGTSFARGLSQVPSGFLSGVAALASKLDALVGSDPVEPPDQLATGRAAAAISRFAQEMFPDDDIVQGDFLSHTLPEALGQGTGFLAGGIGAATAGGGPLAFAGTTGALMQAGDLEGEARAAGASPDKQMLATLAGLGLGATEALGIGGIPARLLKGPVASLKRAFLEAGKEGLEEAVQEVTQQFGSNVTARALYEADRELSAGVMEGGATGGAAGSLLSVGMSLLQAGLPGRQMRATIRPEDVQQPRPGEQISDAPQQPDSVLAPPEKPGEVAAPAAPTVSTTPEATPPIHPPTDTQPAAASPAAPETPQAPKAEAAGGERRATPVQSNPVTREYLTDLLGKDATEPVLKRSLSPDDLLVAGEKIQTGQPLTASTFRGVGKAPGKNLAADVTENALGEGRYSALSEAIAESYGPKVESVEVDLRSPAVLRSDADLSAWAKKGGWTKSEIPDDNAARQPFLRMARQAMEAAGHDGAVVVIERMADVSSVTGKPFKRLREIFDDSQVVEFRKAPRSRAEPETLGRSPQAISPARPGWTGPAETAQARKSRTEALPEQVGIAAHEGSVVEPGDLKTRRQMIDALREAAVVPVRGREGVRSFRKKGLLGLFKTGPEIIHLRDRGDIETLAHEVFHFLEKRLFGTTTYPQVNRRAFRNAMRPFVEELAPIATKGDPMVEGYAEFGALYVTDRARAEAVAPRFYEFFDRMLKEKDPDLHEILSGIHDDWRMFKEAPAEAKVEAAMQPPPTPSRWRFLRDWNSLYTVLVNDLHPVDRAVRQMEKAGGSRLAYDRNAYALMRLTRGVAGKVDHFLQHGTLDFKTHQVNGEGLHAILNDVGGRLREFQRYLVAERALELEGRGMRSGVDRAAAGDVVAKFKREFGPQAKRLYDFQDRVLEYAADSGLLDQETLGKIRELNQNYVPFFRLLEEERGEAGLGRGGRAFSNLAGATKKIRGSSLTIHPPLESILKNTYALIDRADRNAALAELVRQAGKVEGSGRFVEKFDQTRTDITRFPLEEIRRQLQAAGIDPEALKQADAEALLTIFRPSHMLAQGPNVAYVWLKGKPETYWFEPDLYRTISTLNREAIPFYVDRLLTPLRLPAQTLRLGATSANPAWAVMNFARDQFSAFLNSEYGYIPFWDGFQGLFETMRRGDLYQKWLASGGAQAAMASMDRKAMRKQLHEFAAKNKRELFFSMVRHPVELLRRMGELGEAPTRLGEFRKALKTEQAGKPEPAKADLLKAGLASREVSLDFSRAGSLGRVINQFTAFFNANIQGWDKLARVTKEHPVRQMARYLPLTIASLGLYLINRDDDEYHALPGWDKNLFWHFRVPDRVRTDIKERTGVDLTFFRLPKPFLPGLVFGSAPERVMEWMDKKDPTAMRALAASLGADVPNPMPTAALPIVENFANYSLFLDRPLYAPWMEGEVEEWMKSGPSTSAVAQALGYWLDYSPAKIDNLITGYGAGVARTLVRVPEKLQPPGGGEAATPQARDIPLVGRFFSRSPGTSTPHIEEFYRLVEEAGVAEGTLRELKNRGELEEMVRYQKEKALPLARRKSLDEGAKTMKQLRGAIQQVQKSLKLSAQEKRERIDRLYEQMNALAKAYTGAGGEQ